MELMALSAVVFSTVSAVVGIQKEDEVEQTQPNTAKGPLLTFSRKTNKFVHKPEVVDSDKVPSS